MTSYEHARACLCAALDPPDIALECLEVQAGFLGAVTPYTPGGILDRAVTLHQLGYTYADILGYMPAVLRLEAATLETTATCARALIVNLGDNRQGEIPPPESPALPLG